MAADNPYNSDYLERLKNALIDPDDYYDVILQSVGENRIRVMQVLRTVRKLTLNEAKAFLETVPVVVARDLLPYKAMEIKQALEAAGAVATILPDDTNLYERASRYIDL